MSSELVTRPERAPEGRRSAAGGGPSNAGHSAVHSPRIDAHHLERYCFKADDRLLADTTSLLAAVRTADRVNLRQHSKGWRRDLRVKVEVDTPAFWANPERKAAIADALQYLTGDSWSFRFVRRRGPHGPAQRQLLSPPPHQRVFMPFSNGLDSVAIAHELREANPGLEMVLVNFRAKDKLTKWENLGKTDAQRLQSVQVAVYSPDPHHAESTFRSRPFLYDLLAGYGAAVSQPAYVVIPENGQGSLGGSLVPLGAEAPHRSCHPGFTSRLSRVIGAITGEDVRFEHPALFRTKGQVLHGLAQLRPRADEWLSHRSCSYDARHASQGGKFMHCGVCGNCLLRRMSLHWAGVADGTDYRARDLRALALQDAFPEGAPRNLRSAADLALTSARSMQRMAGLADRLQNMRVRSEVAAIAQGLSEPIEVVSDMMESFLKQHQTEWQEFLGFCGSKSWVAQLAEE